MTPDNNRIVFLDYLRVVACLMVMFVHACECFYFGADGGLLIANAGDAFWVTAIDSACRASVPLFVIASSYLLFPVTRPTGEFFRRRFVRVVIPFVFWCALYVWRFDGNAVDCLFNFPMATGGHLWFVPMLLGLYLLMPLLSPWAEKAGEKDVRGWLILWLFTTTFPFLRKLCGLVCGAPSYGVTPYLYGECPWNGFGAFQYVSGFFGYLLMGLYFRKFVPTLSWRKTLAIAAPLWIAGYAIVGSFFYFRIPGGGVFPVSDTYAKVVDLEMSWEFCSLGVALTVLGYFLVLRKFTLGGWFYGKVIRPLSAASYGTYLMHIMVLVVLAEHLKGSVPTPLAILGIAAGSFVISSLASLLIRTLRLKIVVSLFAVCCAAVSFAKPVVVGLVDVCKSESERGVGSEYADAVSAAGAVPLVLPATTNAADIAAALDRVDMLVFCGGEDVAPVRYGETNHVKLGKLNLRRDAWEFAVADEAVRRRMPLLGICRGCQFLNVRFGGTLWQDLPSEKPGAMVHGIKGEHGISVRPDTYLHGLLGADSASVNSRHHQAVKDLAKGFRVAAVAPDGVIEAIESADYPALGVQFHPESLFVRSGRREFLPLFRGDFAKLSPSPDESRLRLLWPPHQRWEVQLLSKAQREYLQKPLAERVKLFADAGERAKLRIDANEPTPTLLSWSWTPVEGEPAPQFTVQVCRDDGLPVITKDVRETYVTVDNLEIGRGYSWTVYARAGGRILAHAMGGFRTDPTPPRLIRVDGVRNVRDLGGRIGLGGRKIRQGLVFRSAGLNDNPAAIAFLTPEMAKVEFDAGTLTNRTCWQAGHMAKIFRGEWDANDWHLVPTDWASRGAQVLTEAGRTTMLETLGIRTDLDLRGAGEVVGMKGSPLGDGVKWVNVHMTAYGGLAKENGKKLVKQCFDVFLDPANYPIDFHCIGGQDRTGTLAFLLEAMLGVDDEELNRDWECSGFTNPGAWFCHEKLFNQIYDVINKHPGANTCEKTEAYLKECGLTDADFAKLRKLLLED